MWLISRRLLDAHIAGVDGLCCLCRPAELAPCPARRLAAAGLRAACATDAAPPTGEAVLDVVRRRLAAGDLDPVDAVAEAAWLSRTARRTAIIRRCAVTRPPRRWRRPDPGSW
jgi:hypothetical protein